MGSTCSMCTGETDNEVLVFTLPAMPESLRAEALPKFNKSDESLLSEYEPFDYLVLPILTSEISLLQSPCFSFKGSEELSDFATEDKSPTTGKEKWFSN